MFVIEQFGKNRNAVYWHGGRKWDSSIEEAAKFSSFQDADDTIDIIRRAGDPAPTAHAMRTPDRSENIDAAEMSR